MAEPTKAEWEVFEDTNRKVSIAGKGAYGPQEGQ